MEQGCNGTTPVYSNMKDKSIKFRNSFRDPNGFELKVLPRSQWSPEYRDLIKNITVSEDYTKSKEDTFAVYKIMFKDGVKYRGQPLNEYHFIHRVESSGIADVLVFAPSADMNYVWSNFKTIKVESWGEMVDDRAIYDSNNK